MKILVDLTIILDVLQRREPFVHDSARVWALAETGAIDAFVAAHSMTTLSYLIRKGKSADHARVVLTEVMRVFAVATVDAITIEQALNLPYSDFEDAVQTMAAVQARADVLVTRNTGDYEFGPLRALTPAELLAIV